jgi:PAS domain S-box-containing protein
VTIPLRVLVLHDRESDAELMVHELRRTGFDPEWRRVETERDYLESLGLGVHVILADDRMPGFTAARALELLRERDLDVPFVVVSGLARLGPAVAEALEQKRLREAERATLAALRESEERYRLIAENVTDGIFLIDLEGRLVFGNRSAEKITGYTLAEFGGQPIFSLLTAKSAEAAMARLSLAETGHSVPPTFQVEIVRNDGRKVWVETHVTNVVKDGQVVGRLGVMSDISERKRAEEALRLLESAVRQAGESIIITTAELDLPGPEIVFVNPAFMKMTGYTADEMIGRTPRILQGPLTDRDMRRRLREDLAAGREFFGETINYRKDRTPFPIALHISPVRDERGAVTHFVAIQRDLTEQKRADEELANQREALYQSEKLSAMGQLLAGVAHELNNPLTVIIGHTTMLRRTAPSDFRERAGKISDAAERCRRIVKNFLALARQHPMEQRRVDLNSVVRGATELLAYPLRVDTVEVSLSLAGDRLEMWGDADQLHQLIVNLISNAHHAMREIGPPRRLTITTRQREGERITLEVADTGPGIPAEIQSRIFEPFFTTKPAGQGTGLGLSLCRSIVERHQGTISVASTRGRGATFCVEIPVGTPSEEAEEAVALSDPPQTRGRRILVVDDDPDVAELLAEVLVRAGHAVETAANGAQALDKIRGGSYDIVFCDMRMPELDGPGLYREVERRRPGLLKRWIFLTGDSLGQETAEFLDRVRAPTLMKPFDLGDVWRLVAAVTAQE